MLLQVYLVRSQLLMFLWCTKIMLVNALCDVHDEEDMSRMYATIFPCTNGLELWMIML